MGISVLHGLWIDRDDVYRILFTSTSTSIKQQSIVKTRYGVIRPTGVFVYKVLLCELRDLISLLHL